MRIELVFWRDAHATLDDYDSEPEDYIVQTVGWVQEQKRFLRVESERTPDGKRFVTRIPKENIVKREVLR